jgi:ElaB/YqjD/DUF883 family membrane-anchored ribosome-binding protein
MKQSILFSIALGCVLAHPIMAKANSSEVDQILNDVNRLDQEADRLIQQSQPEAQRYQAYLNNLYWQCMRGNRSACAEHGQRMKEQQRWLDYLKERQDEFYRNRTN